MKPVDVDELKAALNKLSKLSITAQKEQLKIVKQVLNDGGDTLILSLQDSFQVVNLKELMYCESDKGYTTFYCSDGKQHLVSKTLKEFEEQLTEASFIRPHQSFMVNLNFIDKYDKSGAIHLKNKIIIPVSTRKKESFLSTFLNLNRSKNN